MGGVRTANSARAILPRVEAGSEKQLVEIDYPD
jgi:hypothetical protein